MATICGTVSDLIVVVVSFYCFLHYTAFTIVILCCWLVL